MDSQCCYDEETQPPAQDFGCADHIGAEQCFCGSDAEGKYTKPVDWVTGKVVLATAKVVVEVCTGCDEDGGDLTTDLGCDAACEQCASFKESRAIGCVESASNEWTPWLIDCILLYGCG